MIRIFIADDHEIFRQGLVSLMKTAGDMEVVGEAADGLTALAQIEELKPDISIIDINMPGMNGLQVVEELVKRKVPTRIVLLTMLNDPATVSRALRFDISAYVPKENAIADLLYALRAAASGQQFISPLVTKKLHQHLYKREQTMQLLSAREHEILQLIAHGLSSKQIAEKLFISVRTVDTHRIRIMDKLGIHKATDLVKYAINNGLID